MARFLLPLIILGAVLFAACGAPAGSSLPPVTVQMTANTFAPDPVTVAKGQQVCWVNNDTQPRWPASNIHPTHQIYPEFDPKQGVAPGETWCFAFMRSGIWKYHDHIFPEIVGTVNVDD